MRLAILLIAFLFSLARGGVPLDDCSSGRAIKNPVPSKIGSCGYGAWNSSTGVLTQLYASINEALYNQGIACGECFEITGPAGVLSVVVTDVCPASTPGCDGSIPEFVLSGEAFSALNPNTADQTIYEIGFRHVSCDLSGDIRIKFGNDSNLEYLNMLVLDSVVGITEMTLRSPDWNQSYSVPRQNSATFIWNQRSLTLSFPLVLTLSSETGVTVSTTLPSLPIATTVSLPNFPQPTSSESSYCAMPAVNPIIYDDELQYGWSYFGSFAYDQTSFNATPAANGSFSLFVHLEANGAFVLTREGDFLTSFYSDLNFAARTDDATNFDNLEVYFTGSASHVSVPGISQEFQYFSIPFASLDPSQAENGIVFFNNAGSAVGLYLDEITFSGLISTPSIIVSPLEGYNGNQTLNTTITGNSTLTNSSSTTSQHTNTTTSSPSSSTTTSPSSSSSATSPSTTAGVVPPGTSSTTGGRASDSSSGSSTSTTSEASNPPHSGAEVTTVSLAATTFAALALLMFVS